VVHACIICMSLSCVCFSLYVMCICIYIFVYCILGFMLQFVYLCFLGFWCFHLLHLFLGLAFPYKAKLWLDSSSRRAKIHIFEVVLVMLYGLSFPIIILTGSDYSYNGSSCAARSLDFLIYGELLPEIALFCFGLVLLFTSLWILRRVSCMKSVHLICL